MTKTRVRRLQSENAFHASFPLLIRSYIITNVFSLPFKPKDIPSHRLSFSFFIRMVFRIFSIRSFVAKTELCVWQQVFDMTEYENINWILLIINIGQHHFGKWKTLFLPQVRIFCVFFFHLSGFNCCVYGKLYETYGRNVTNLQCVRGIITVEQQQQHHAIDLNAKSRSTSR